MMKLCKATSLLCLFLHSGSVTIFHILAICTLDQIKHLSTNPKHYPSLTTLDSLLTNTHMLNPATSLIIID
ncbi:hypothetical protein Hanom_Chr03g00234631 [Helianthus anomalus]